MKKNLSLIIALTLFAQNIYCFNNQIISQRLDDIQKTIEKSATVHTCITRTFGDERLNKLGINKDDVKEKMANQLELLAKQKRVLEFLQSNSEIFKKYNDEELSRFIENINNAEVLDCIIILVEERNDQLSLLKKMKNGTSDVTKLAKQQIMQNINEAFALLVKQIEFTLEKKKAKDIPCLLNIKQNFDAAFN